MFPRVKEILIAAQKGGIEQVKIYFNQDNMVIDPNTWCGHIKKSIDENRTISVMSEIKILTEKFNNYENVSQEKNRRNNSTPINGKGDKDNKG